MPCIRKNAGKRGIPRIQEPTSALRCETHWYRVTNANIRKRSSFTNIITCQILRQRDRIASVSMYPKRNRCLTQKGASNGLRKGLMKKGQRSHSRLQPLLLRCRHRAQTKLPGILTLGIGSWFLELPKAESNSGLSPLALVPPCTTSYNCHQHSTNKERTI